MRKMPTHKFIGILIVLFSLGMIAYQATKNESTVTFFTPEEIYATPDKFFNKLFRMSGLVLMGSKHIDVNTQILTFQMTDLNHHDFFVSYKGTPPDLFKEGQGVIVEGRLEQMEAKDSGIRFHIMANLLIVKHSEVYNTKEDHSKMREIKLRESLFNATQK